MTAHAETLTELRSKLLDWMCSTADVIPWEADARFGTIGKIEPNA